MAGNSSRGEVGPVSASPTAAYAQLLEQGMGAHRRGQPELAQDHYLQARQECPQDPESYRLLGNLLLEQGRYPEASVVLLALRDMRPEVYEHHLWLGACLTHLGRSSEAREVLEQARILRPDATVPLYFLGLGDGILESPRPKFKIRA